MTRRPTPLVAVVAGLAAWALFLALVSNRAELLVAAIPLMVALLSARVAGGDAAFRLEHEVPVARVIENENIAVAVTLTAKSALPQIEILEPLPAAATRAAGANRVVHALGAGARAGWRYEVRLGRRGQCRLGILHVRVWDRSGLSVAETRYEDPKLVEAYPRIPSVRHLPRPLEAQRSFGNYVARGLGDGIEPGEIRLFAPGDRIRRIDWRASLRFQRLYVMQFQEERNADVVLLLDTCSETGARPDSSLEISVRAAAALAGGYLSRKDRVGLIEYGGHARWIRPASGWRQNERLLQALLPANVVFSYVAADLDVLPPRVLPPNALVIAISPLLDTRFVAAAANLGARGVDLLVLAVSPIDLTVRAMGGMDADGLAVRLWRLEWKTRVDALRGRGFVILEWNPDEPLDAALARFMPRRLRRGMRR